MKMRTDPLRRVAFLDLSFDPVSLDEAIETLQSVSRHSEYSYIVTPNVDHLVRLHNGAQRDRDHEDVRVAYRDATLCVCDSRILARLAKVFGINLSVVPGSDLTARLLGEVVIAGDVILVVGGDHTMVETLRLRYPEILVRHHVPPMGLRHNVAAMEIAADHVISSGARFTFLAVGSPQQELLARRIAAREDAKGCALCIGASISFVVGHEVRAPRALQKLGLEWGWRLAQNPARLWRRYLVEGPKIFLIAWHWRQNSLSRR